MSTFKRFLAWTLVVISIVGILACTIGFVGSWLINDRLTDGILNLLSGIQVTLSSVETSLTSASTQLHSANSAINTLQEAASQLGGRIEENTPILDKITQVLSEELGPSINRLRDIFLPIWERILAINNTIEALNALPGIELPTLTPQIQTLNDQIQKVSDAVLQLQANISDLKSGIVENVLVPFLAKIDTIAAYLITLEKDVNTYLEQLNRLQAAVVNLQEQIPSTIDTLTILLSILLIWVILAQISVILAARLYLKTGRKIWEFFPGEQAPGETVLEPQ